MTNGGHNNIIVTAIPPFNNYGCLPPGIHVATMEAIRKRFAYNPKRKQLFFRFQSVVAMLASSDCPEVFLNGSFITSKEEPNDYDMCWEPCGIKATKEVRILLQNPQNLKQQFLGDIRPRIPSPPYQIDLVDHWQTDAGGEAKGIIRINLRKDNDQE